MNNVEIIANWFQIAEAIAVVATLLFIAVQIRETRRIAAADSYQGLFQSVNQFYNTLSTTHGLAQLYIKGRKHPASLAEEERSRFFYACVQWFCFYENLYLQYSHGLLPKQYFDAWCEAFTHDLRDPGFVAYWKQERLDYAKEFRMYVDRTLKKHGITELTISDNEEKLFAAIDLHYDASPVTNNKNLSKAANSANEASTSTKAIVNKVQKQQRGLKRRQ
jgi:hypothetical protein